MIPEIGTILIIASLLSAILQAVPSAKYLSVTVFMTFFLSALAFGLLVFAFVTSDFSVENVFLNSSKITPSVYKFTASWGNHEGSILLWLCILNFYGVAFALFSKAENNIRNTTLHIQGILSVLFTCFVLITSNPFARISPIPENGVGLNPLLQDIGLAIHPPILYFGYLGFSIVFSFAVALLLQKQASSNSFNHLKPWAAFGWTFLTLGISLGSWWAYRELGWGGFWFWDPVENSSLLPWLVATALIHNLLIASKRDIFKKWSILLALMVFILAVMATFLVRSGVLTSVHAFADDPKRGIFILAILFILIACSFTLFALNAKHFHKNVNLFFSSKEGSITINNMLFMTALGVVLLGTLYPLFSQLFFSTPVSVGAPYFNITFNSIALLVIFFSLFGAGIKWQHERFLHFIARFWQSFLLAMFTAWLVWYFTRTDSVMTLMVILVGTWSLFGLIKLAAESREHLTISFYAMALAHAGVAILAIAIAITSNWSIEIEKAVNKGEIITIGNYYIRFDGVDLNAHENYLTKKGVFQLFEHNRNVTTLIPEIRYYPIENKTTMESDIYYKIFSNIYVVLSDEANNKNYIGRFYYKPFINLIWLGAIMMVIGGLLVIKTKRGVLK